MHAGFQVLNAGKKKLPNSTFIKHSLHEGRSLRLSDRLTIDVEDRLNNATNVDDTVRTLLFPKYGHVGR